MFNIMKSGAGAIKTTCSHILKFRSRWIHYIWLESFKKTFSQNWANEVKKIWMGEQLGKYNFSKRSDSSYRSVWDKFGVWVKLFQKRRFEQSKRISRRRSWQNHYWQEVRLLIQILPRNRNLGKNFSKLILKLYLGVGEKEKRKTCNFSIK